MKNEIRTIDLIAYFEARKARLEKLVITEAEKRGARIAKHNGSIWFGWDCDEGFSGCNNDKFWRYTRWIQECKENLQKLTYRQKRDMQTTAWDFGGGRHEESFYNWCMENNIPF